MKKAFIQLHLSVFLAGFTGILGKLISMNEGLLTWYRLLISAITVYLLFRWRGLLKKLPLRDVLIIGSNGAIIGLHWIFFYGSIKYANVSIGVVCFSLTSLFTAIFDPLINRRRFDGVDMLLSLLTLLGILLIFHFDTQYRTGIILGIISAMFAALFTVFNKRLILRFDTYTLGFYELVVGTLSITLILPFYLRAFPAASLLPSLSDAAYLLALAWACTVWLYALNLNALKKISAFTVNLCFNLEPVYSILLAFLLFQENKYLHLSFYAGLFCILLSVVLQMMRVSRQPVQP
ncbi:DMT family transporter [Chitinophaga japonensis]|uniref:Threonine/homoserine efflux transporter RhtA n=1 Tax=Chitinophaga japonensis TaxID=104662 RepID=A0A562T581_CHIJA|nr:DMT family transporter [Chitinophaga japonensis]TWI88689.1 threonine/homoserine efflux transporter RhtA [Chitinophaga japonensis]